MKTLELYDHVITENYGKRPVKKSLLFACIYYASNLCQEPIRYVRLKKNLTKISYSKVNRGIPKGSEFDILTL